MEWRVKPWNGGNKEERSGGERKLERRGEERRGEERRMRMRLRWTEP